MTSDIKIQLIRTRDNWEMVDIIQETQKIQDQIRNGKKEKDRKKKEKWKRIEPVVPKATLPTPRIVSQ
jgi:hypothetical protein